VRILNLEASSAHRHSPLQQLELYILLRNRNWGYNLCNEFKVSRFSTRSPVGLFEGMDRKPLVAPQNSEPSIIQTRKNQITQSAEMDNATRIK
jgi:hypothetical protein